ncbi:MAG: bile acid:sodium symporter family protein [Lewinellaceae bacterium]|nr:bile acid:sodium symporter family protein [Lewinellaceae bacterium]
MDAIDAIRINFSSQQLALLNVCLGFLMFGVALDLHPEQFKQLLRRPKAAFIGLTSQWVVLPVLTLVLIFILKPPPSIALGMLLVSACPGGNVSNYAVHLSGANAALSVLLTTVSSLAAAFVTPAVFALLGPRVPGAAPLLSNIAVDPAAMIWTILELIGIPLVLGMGIQRQFPRLAAAIRPWIQRASMLIFLGFVVFALIGNLPQIKSYLHLIFFVVLAHNSLALVSGYWFARGSGLSRFDARAVSIETGIQNSGLGLVLIFNFFDGLGGMALVAAWWGIWHLLSSFLLALWWRQRPVSDGFYRPTGEIS